MIRNYDDMRFIIFSDHNISQAEVVENWMALISAYIENRFLNDSASEHIAINKIHSILANPLWIKDLLNIKKRQKLRS